METNMNETMNENKIARPTEGAKKHLWSFFLSMALTLIAFAAVGGGLFNSALSLSLFLVALAAVQATVQLAIWMHLSHRGHEFPIAFFATGSVFAIIFILGCFMLSWW